MNGGTAAGWAPGTVTDVRWSRSDGATSWAAAIARRKVHVFQSHGRADPILPFALAIAAACFLYVAVADLIPGLHRRVDAQVDPIRAQLLHKTGPLQPVHDRALDLGEMERHPGRAQLLACTACGAGSRR